MIWYVTAEWSHAGNDDNEHPSVSEVRCHLFYLDFLKFADTLMQALFHISLKDFLTSSVLFYELRRILGTVQS
jgi:hypothetical protein